MQQGQRDRQMREDDEHESVTLKTKYILSQQCFQDMTKRKSRSGTTNHTEKSSWQAKKVHKKQLIKSKCCGAWCSFSWKSAFICSFIWNLTRIKQAFLHKVMHKSQVGFYLSFCSNGFSQFFFNTQASG